MRGDINVKIWKIIWRDITVKLRYILLIISHMKPAKGIDELVGISTQKAAYIIGCEGRILNRGRSRYRLDKIHKPLLGFASLDRQFFREYRAG